MVTFIYGMLTMWMILSVVIYTTTFHTSQTTNWDTWFYWIICFPLFLIGFPFYLIIGIYQEIKSWAQFNWKHDWRWKWEDFTAGFKNIFHYWY